MALKLQIERAAYKFRFLWGLQNVYLLLSMRVVNSFMVAGYSEKKNWKRNHGNDGRQIWESSCCLFFYIADVVVVIALGLPRQVGKKNEEEKLWGAAAASPNDLMVQRGRGGGERRMKDEGHAMPLRTKLPNVI